MSPLETPSLKVWHSNNNQSFDSEESFDYN